MGFGLRLSGLWVLAFEGCLRGSLPCVGSRGAWVCVQNKEAKGSWPRVQRAEYWRE